MATPAQLAANRRNARKSTGPRTPAGKTASRMNALKSGLHAESHVIRGEDPAALAQLAADYYAEFRPATPRQRDLVDTLVHNTWLIRRLRATEAELYAYHFADFDEDFDHDDDYDRLCNAHPLADSFTTLDRKLLRLQSRLNSLERSNRAAIKELATSQPAEPAPQPVDEPASSPEIGFVPSTAPESLIPDPIPMIPAERSEAPRAILEPKATAI